MQADAVENQSEFRGPGRVRYTWFRLQRDWSSGLLGVVALAVVAGAIFAIATSPNVRWTQVGRYLANGQIMQGVTVTIELTFICMSLGIGLAVILASMRISRNRILRSVSATYVWFFRGTPLLVQLIFWYNIALFVPQVSLFGASVSMNTIISPLTAAVLGLSLNAAAYMAEIVRSGIISVDRGQTEAALALGFTPRQTLVKIVLPQATRVIVPPTANQTIDMFKATSLCSVIGTGDLLARAENIYSQNFLVIELLFVACFWYLLITTVATFVQGLLERRLALSVGHGAERKVSMEVHHAA